jgi:hypothetical protein
VKDDDGNTLFTVIVPVLFGLKNPFGYLSRWLGGLLISYDANGLGHVYVNRKFYTQKNTPDTVDGLLEVSTVPSVTTTTWHYIKELSMQNLCGMPSVASGAGESTYYCDGTYLVANTVSALRRPAVGGLANGGSLAGLACSFLSYGVSGASASFGAPLCEAAEDWDTTPTEVD